MNLIKNCYDEDFKYLIFYPYWQRSLKHHRINRDAPTVYFDNGSYHLGAIADTSHQELTLPFHQILPLRIIRLHPQKTDPMCILLDPMK